MFDPAYKKLLDLVNNSKTLVKGKVIKDLGSKVIVDTGFSKITAKKNNNKNSEVYLVKANNEWQVIPDNVPVNKTISTKTIQNRITRPREIPVTLIIVLDSPYTLSKIIYQENNSEIIHFYKFKATWDFPLNNTENDTSSYFISNPIAKNYLINLFINTGSEQINIEETSIKTYLENNTTKTHLVDSLTVFRKLPNENLKINNGDITTTEINPNATEESFSDYVESAYHSFFASSIKSLDKEGYKNISRNVLVGGFSGNVLKSIYLVGTLTDSSRSIITTTLSNNILEQTNQIVLFHGNVYFINTSDLRDNDYLINNNEINPDYNKILSKIIKNEYISNLNQLSINGVEELHNNLVVSIEGFDTLEGSIHVGTFGTFSVQEVYRPVTFKLTLLRTVYTKTYTYNYEIVQTLFEEEKVTMVHNETEVVTSNKLVRCPGALIEDLTNLDGITWSEGVFDSAVYSGLGFTHTYYSDARLYDAPAFYLDVWGDGSTIIDLPAVENVVGAYTSIGQGYGQPVIITYLATTTKTILQTSDFEYRAFKIDTYFLNNTIKQTNTITFKDTSDNAGSFYSLTNTIKENKEVTIMRNFRNSVIFLEQSTTGSEQTEIKNYLDLDILYFDNYEQTRTYDLSYQYIYKVLNKVTGEITELDCESFTFYLYNTINIENTSFNVTSFYWSSNTTKHNSFQTYIRQTQILEYPNNTSSVIYDNSVRFQISMSNVKSFLIYESNIYSCLITFNLENETLSVSNIEKIKSISPLKNNYDPYIVTANSISHVISNYYTIDYISATNKLYYITIQEETSSDISWDAVTPKIKKALTGIYCLKDDKIILKNYLLENINYVNGYQAFDYNPIKDLDKLSFI